MNFKDQNKLKAVTFSYDDGTTQDIRLVELLDKYGLKSTFNINSDLLGTSGKLQRNNNYIAHYKIAPEDVKYVYDGHEVAVHTLTHPNLTMLEEDEIIRQVEQDRLNLSELVDYEVLGMAYPCGGTNCNERTAKLIKNNTPIKYARTIDITQSFEPYPDLYQYKGNGRYGFNWDELFALGKEFINLKTDTPKVFYIWGHSYELDLFDGGWEQYEKFCKFISNKSDIFYGTNIEIIAE